MYLENASPFEAEITMPLDRDGREMVVLAVKGTYDFPTEPGGVDARLADRQIKVLSADVSGRDAAADAPVAENDLAPFKPRCDVLVHGPAIAPGGRPTTKLDVGVRIGEWRKAFSVHGERIWLKSALGHRVSDPRPFTRQILSYDVAWGGVDRRPGDPTRAATCEENPVGVGYYPHREKREGAPLPVTAERGEIIADPYGPHRPMAFGPLGRNWLPRRSYAGTYDDRWLERRVPLLPEDFDDRYFQASPPDQQIPYPQGGEPVELINLTSSGRSSFLLPRDRVVANFARRRGPISQRVANLDTVLILAEAGKLCLTWRVRFVADRDMHELARVTVLRQLEGAIA